MRHLLLCTLHFLSVVLCFQESLLGQNVTSMDAESAGTANPRIATTTCSPFNLNPANQATASRIYLGFSCMNTFMVQELSTANLAIIYPGTLGAFGMNIGFFGSSYYNEQRYSMSYSKALGSGLHGGVRFNYLLVDISSELVKPMAISGDLGLLMTPVEHLSVGALLVNITGAKYFNHESEKLKQGFVTGASWAEKQFLIMAHAEIYKNLPTVLGIGTEIKMGEQFDIRLGASTKDAWRYTFGFGYGLENLQADMAFSYHPVLGYTSYLTCYFAIGKQRN